MRINEEHCLGDLKIEAEFGAEEIRMPTGIGDKYFNLGKFDYVEVTLGSVSVKMEGSLVSLSAVYPENDFSEVEKRLMRVTSIHQLMMAIWYHGFKEGEKNARR